MGYKVAITGASGMVGKGILFECLKDQNIEKVVCIGRKPLDVKDEKIAEIIVKDFREIKSDNQELQGIDACFFGAGISALGLSEEQYKEITYDLTLHLANICYDINPNSIFCYVSGAGTDSSEKGRMMWARVKGKTENDLLKMNFKSVYLFRPGFIQPMDGIKSRTKLYNALYIIFKPIYFILKKFPSSATNTRNLGKAMINTLVKGYPKKILENKDINQLAEA